MAKALPYTELPVFGLNKPVPIGDDLPQYGMVLVNKELDWSSFHAVKLVRNRLKIKKVGHAGTLDPLATGLLIICFGKATKSIDQIQSLEKEYVGEITFGSSTPSYDRGTDPDEFAETDHLTTDLIKNCIEEHFTGEIEQIPPMYSAIKKEGQRLYNLARKGKIVERDARKVNIYEYEVLEWNLPTIKVRIRCSKGTYIRSLAHDLGVKLGSRAYLSQLERTAIGEFRVDDAITVSKIKEDW